MERYKKAVEEEIEKGGILEGSTVIVKNEITFRVITKEGYVYEITENKVELIGKQGENSSPELQESNIEFRTNPSGYTDGNITVEIITKIELGNNTLQYSTNGTTWEKYENAITFEENGPIYARIINTLDEIGEVATKTIDTIDREDPNQAIVNFSSTTVDTETEIVATVIQSDNGTSGVNMTKCKWIYTESETELGKNEASYTGGTFKENQEEVKTKITNPGTYYLHILTMDKVGHKTETVKGPITVVDFLSINDNIDYMIDNPDIFLDKVLSNENTVKSLANNDYAKTKIKENSTWYSALKNCDYAYTTWTQPILTSNATTVDEGIVRTSASIDFPAAASYFALDGKKSNGEGGYWWPNNSPAYWQVEFPYEIRIKGVDYYNQYSTDPRNLTNTARLYTNSTKTIPIGDSFSASYAWQKISISGITKNKIVTNTIYFYCMSGYAGIGELVIDADKFIF